MDNNKKIIKFDLHCHTKKSDGKSSAAEIFRRAKELGIDVLAITDHNRSTDNLDPKGIYRKYKVKFISGVELSLLNGHFLILGVDPKLIDAKLIEWKLKAKRSVKRIRKSKIRKMLKWSIEQGALVIVAHPYVIGGKMSIKKRFLNNLYKEGLIHGAEVHNDDLQRRMPQKMYRAWHRSVLNFLKKSNIPMYANSDAHRLERLGNRYNEIEIDNLDNILEILKKGKVKIKHGYNEPVRHSIRKRIGQKIINGINRIKNS